MKYFLNVCIVCNNFLFYVGVAYTLTSHSHISQSFSLFSFFFFFLIRLLRGVVSHSLGWPTLGDKEVVGHPKWTSRSDHITFKAIREVATTFNEENLAVSTNWLDLRICTITAWWLEMTLTTKSNDFMKIIFYWLTWPYQLLFIILLESLIIWRIG